MERSQLVPLKKVIAGTLVIIVVIVIFFILTTPGYKALKLIETPFRTASFSTAQDTTIYSYSGISFYKQTMDSNGPMTVLNSGVRLPAIHQMFWAGDNGVLLTFIDGGYSGSVVEQELTARNLTWDNQTQQFIWYLDFETSRLELVSIFPLISETAYYNKDTESLYFIRGNGYLPDSDVPNGIPLVSYSTKNRSETKLLNDTGSTSAKHVGICRNEATVCFTVKDGGGETLYQVRNGKKEKVIQDRFDVLSPTYDPSIYIGIRYDEIPKASAHDSGLLQATPYYIDLETGLVSATNTKIGATESILTNSIDTGGFYLLEPTSQSDKTDVSYVAGARNLLGSLKTDRQVFPAQSKAEPTSKSIVTPISRTAHSVSMFGDIEENMYLVTPKDFVFTIEQQRPSNIKSKLTPCFEKYTKGYDYVDDIKQFKVRIEYDETFQKHIKDFTSCIDKTYPSAYTGYLFVIVGVSPVDGRFVTD